MNDAKAALVYVSCSLIGIGGLLSLPLLAPADGQETEKVPVPGPTVTETARFPVKVPVPGPTITKKVVVTKTIRPKVPKEVTRSDERKKQTPSVPAGSARGAAKAIFGSQYSCAASLVSHESGWNVRATNPSSGAYGLPQALPGSKMASAGSDWQTNPVTQLRWMKSYVDSRYGGACSAWSFWTSHHYY